MRSSDHFTRLGKLKRLDWTALATPAHWFRGEPLLTYLGNAFIVVAPDMERFIINVARSFKNQITDDALRLAWHRFIQEEKGHAYQHVCVSHDLKRHHYPVTFMMTYSNVMFRAAFYVLRAKSRLALVLAIEFYSHELAMLALENNVFPEDELAVYDFLRWHAKEELSHFSLCATVYRTFGGGYCRRVLMLLLFLSFIATTIMIFFPLFFIVDVYQRRAPRLKHIRTAFSYLYGRNGLLWRRAKTFLAFFRYERS